MSEWFTRSHYILQDFSFVRSFAGSFIHSFQFIKKSAAERTSDRTFHLNRKKHLFRSEITLAENPRGGNRLFFPKFRVEFHDISYKISNTFLYFIAKLLTSFGKTIWRSCLLNSPGRNLCLKSFQHLLVNPCKR